MYWAQLESDALQISNLQLGLRLSYNYILYFRLFDPNRKKQDYLSNQGFFVK